MTKIDGWPDNNKCLDLEDIIDPLIEVIYQAYAIKPYNRTTPLKYTGPSVGSNFGILAVGHDAAEQFLPENIEYDEERGREVLHIVLRVAVQLGMEQGRRFKLAGHSANTQATYLKLLGSILEKYNLDNDDEEMVEYLLCRLKELVDDK